LGASKKQLSTNTKMEQATWAYS